MFFMAGRHHLIIWSRIVCVLSVCNVFVLCSHVNMSRSQWQCGLRCRSTASYLLRSWVQFPPGAWMFVVSCVLSGRGLCDELIARPGGVLLTVVCCCVIKKPRVMRWPWKNGHSRWAMPVAKTQLSILGQKITI
jgi:hypothetical protein